VNRIPFNEPTAQFCLPRAQAPLLQPGAFMVCPILYVNADLYQSQLMLYRMAYERALATLQQSWPERDVLGVWN
jgi:hypothetical protein